MKAFFYFSIFFSVTTITFADSFQTFSVNGVVVHEDELEKLWDSSKLGEGDILTATVNEYTDKLLANLDVFLKADGEDPLLLPDIEQEIRKKILFIHYKGSLKLTYVSLDGLSSIHRSGDSSVSYDTKSKKVRFEIPLELSEIDFTCQFKAKLPPFSSHGRLTGAMKDVNMVTSIEIDLQEMKASVLEYKITRSGSIKVHFHVGKLIDWLMNLIGDAATGIFKKKIIKEVDNLVTNVMEKGVDIINQIIHVPSIMNAPLSRYHNSARNKADYKSFF